MTDKEKYDFIDHVVHLTLSEEDRLLNEHGGKYSGLQEDGIDSNEYYRIITERVISILKKNKNYMQEEPVSEELKKAAKQYSFYIPTQCEATETWKKETEQHFIDGAKWKLAKNKSITLDNLGEFINELSKQFPEVSFAKVCKIATRTAKWLKQQMMKDETQNL
jgi:DNA repair ATPase RecN